MFLYRSFQHDYPVPEQPTENVVGSFALGCLFYHYWCKWHSVIIHYNPDQVNLDVCDDEHGAEKTQENPGVHSVPFYAVITGFTHATVVRALCIPCRPLLWSSLSRSRAWAGTTAGSVPVLCAVCSGSIFGMILSSGIHSLVLCMVSLVWCVPLFLLLFYHVAGQKVHC